MRLPKSLRRIAGPAFMGLALLCANPVAADELYLEGNINSGLDVGATSMFQVGNIPLDIRDVPKHPDDGYALNSNVAPINDDTVTLSNPIRGNLEGRLGIGLKGEWYDFKLGARAGFILGSSSAIRERNYTTYPGTTISGTGAALTYYRIFLREGINPDFGADAKFSVKLPKKDILDETYWNCFIEYSADFFDSLLIENGWDRWSRLQVNQNYTIADIIHHAIKIGISHVCPAGNGELSTDIFAGVDFPQLIKTDLGNQMSVTAYPSLFFGAKVSVGLNTRR